jgi:hypothetical protein
VAFVSLLRREGPEAIPLLGSFGLAMQIGSVEYARPRRFREKLEQWLDSIRVLWPDCPAHISPDGSSLQINRAQAVKAVQTVTNTGNLEAFSSSKVEPIYG